ncbi:hypothetical protein [Bacillus amyloliquefaciens]|uniref:hypothetical protein n=1 Tax=Bacillus subtilis group TaxID=653685 RepID=UPI0005F007CB|nr:hypothetical protein [Bacillus amyloliquefaciens]
MSKKTNITFAFTEDEYEDLVYLIDYFQSRSISTVTRADVIRFLIKQMKETIEKDKLQEVNQLLKEADEE